MAKTDVISALPVELAQKIFTLAAEDSQLGMTIALSCVSRRWREIALGTRALWTKIDVPHICRRPEVLNMYLARAGSLPLQLHMEFRFAQAKSKDYDDGDDSGEFSERMRSLLSILQRYIGQLRVLSITSTQYDTFKMFEEMFKSAAAPVLEALSLQCLRPNPVYRSEHGEGQFLGGAPLLKSCCFQGLSLSYVASFPSPKHLYISDGVRGRTGSSLREVGGFLEKHAALEYLSVQSQIFKSWPRPEALPSPVRMDSLRTLILSHRCPQTPSFIDWDCDLLLDIIETPNLKTLVFIDIRFFDLSLPRRVLVHPHFPKLETLAIIRVHQIMLEPLVAHMPAVSHLMLVHIPDGNDASDEAFMELIGDLYPAEDAFDKAFMDLIGDLYPVEDAFDELNSQAMSTFVLFTNLQILTVHPVYMGNLCMLLDSRKASGYPLSKVRMDISSLDEEATARLPWLREHVEVEDIDPYEIVEEFDRGFPGEHLQKPDFLFV